MSKEATGENGAILGSSEYWDRVNRATFFGRLMRNASDTNYQETLREVGHRAGSAVEEIYDDLQNKSLCHWILMTPFALTKTRRKKNIFGTVKRRSLTKH